MKKAKAVKDILLYGRTQTGQMVYDVLFSRLSAVAVSRRYRGLSREFILRIRRSNPEMRPRGKP